MKNKAIWAGLASFLLMMGVSAAPVTLETAKQTAEKFYGVQLQKAAVKSLPALSCVYPKNTKKADFVPYYIFNAEKEQGFVIVAGDDNAASLILGYSDQGHFETENMPENLKFWLGFYEEGVRNAAARSGNGDMQVKTGFTKAEVVKEPLLDSIQYNQDAPYNDLCPIDPTTGKRSVTGCVATALASIARYYEYPKHGQDSISYSKNGLNLSMNFANNTYDWENILKTYKGSLSQYTEDQRNAVAMLMRDMGYAVQMGYSSKASGAFREPTTVGMVQYMGFDSILNYRERTDYDNDDQWIAVLKDNLDNDLPVYYTGQGDGGGHAFVCDGYNDDDFFHFNWGWGGLDNGYFSVRNLDPDDITGIGAGTGGGYTQMQAILHNMVPPGHKRCQDEFLLTTSSSIEAKQIEDSVYSIKGTPLEIAFRGIKNNAMAFFKGSLALAAFQDGEFLRIISTEKPIEIIKRQTTAGENSWIAMIDSLTDGEYEIWVVSKQDSGTNSRWSKVYVSKANRFSTNDSYIPLRIDNGKYELLKTTSVLKVQIDCYEKRNIDMYIYFKGEYIAKKQVSASTIAQFDIRNGVYQFRFWTREYDTTYVDIEITKDTTIEVKMQETYVQPYVRGVRVEGNTAIMFWFATPTGQTANPAGFVVYLDNVEVARVDASATQYEFKYLSLGEHTAGLSSIFKTGESEIVTYPFQIRIAENEKPWNGVCRISPNPSANGYFMLEVDRDCRLQVASVSGKVLFERELVAGSHPVDMSAYNTGVYLFRLSGKNGESTVLKAVLR